MYIKLHLDSEAKAKRLGEQQAEVTHSAHSEPVMSAHNPDLFLM